MASALMLASLMGLLGSLHLPGANAQFGRGAHPQQAHWKARNADLQGGSHTDPASWHAGCADLGDALLNDACSGFVSYVKDSNEYYYGRTNAELRTYISKTPAPSAQCAHQHDIASGNAAALALLWKSCKWFLLVLLQVLRGCLTVCQQGAGSCVPTPH